MNEWIVIPKEDYIAHHGIMGQKWGKKNGPPYPLSDDVSTGHRLKKQTTKVKKADKSPKRKSGHSSNSDTSEQKEDMSRYNSLGYFMGESISKLKKLANDSLLPEEKGKEFVKSVKNVKPEYERGKNTTDKVLDENKKKSSESESKDPYEDMFMKNLKKIRSDSKTKAAFKNYVKEKYPDRNLSEIDDDRLDAMMDDYAEYLTDRQYYK